MVLPIIGGVCRRLIQYSVNEHPELRIYAQLQQCQLFQGMSQGELLQMAGNTRFGFQKVLPGVTLLEEGDDCRQLFFLVRGQIAVTTRSDDHSYHLSEWLQAPWLIQPEALFGVNPRNTYSVRTMAECQFITLSKDEVLRLQDDFLTFRLNLLNLLASQGQRRGRVPWRRSPRTLEERFVRFVVDRVVYPAGHKELYILMKQLAVELVDTRLNVSRMLNSMQQRGLIELSRGRIDIPMLEQMFV